MAGPLYHGIQIYYFQCRIKRKSQRHRRWIACLSQTRRLRKQWWNMQWRSWKRKHSIIACGCTTTVDCGARSALLSNAPNGLKANMMLSRPQVLPFRLIWNPSSLSPLKLTSWRAYFMTSAHQTGILKPHSLASNSTAATSLSIYFQKNCMRQKSKQRV